MVTGSGGIDGCRGSGSRYSHSIVAGGFDEMS
jgi:hypothetical protein